MIEIQKQQRRMNFLNRTQQRTSLRVVVEKIGKASAVVHGDLSKEALKELLMSELSLTSKTFEREVIKVSQKKVPQDSLEEILKDNNDEILENIDQEVLETIDKKVSENIDEKVPEDNEIEILGNDENGEQEEIERNTQFFKKNENREIDIIEEDKKTETFEKKLTEDGKRGNREKHKKNIYVKDLKSPDRNFCAIRKSQEILNELLIHHVCMKEEEEENLNLSKNSEWLKKHFKTPLILAMNEIIVKKPSDPVNYLGFWLLNYKSTEENQETETRLEKEERKEENRNQIKEISELIMENKDKVSLQEEESAEKWNLTNYESQ